MTHATETAEICECTRCNGFAVLTIRRGYRQFDMVTCGRCDGTGLEPAADHDTYSAFYGCLEHGHDFGPNPNR